VQYDRRLDAARGAADIEQSNERALAWLDVFQRQAGRRLRVLHVGNIANNAYNNAKIQRERGIEADVLCYDYYHIMGTPEWEDADIKGSVDNFHPDWWAVDLGDWQRPDWFVQGPLLDCLDYLRTKHRGTSADQRRARRRLIDAYWAILEQSAAVAGRRRPWRDPLSAGAVATTVKLASELAVNGNALRASGLAGLRDYAARSALAMSDPMHVRAAALQVRTGLLDPALERYQRGDRVSHLDRATVAAFRLWRKDIGVAGNAASPQVAPAPAMSARELARHTGHLAASAVGWASGRVLTRVLRVRQPVGPTVASGTTGAAEAEIASLRQRQLAVRAHYRSTFKDTPEQAVNTEITHADCLSGHLADVMAHYDIVQAYSTDGLTPLFAGVTRFCAYEHGTIREIPFEDNLQGRLCKFTYRHAPRVFVTNSDVLPSIARIGIPPHRVTYLPHAFNDAKLRRFRDDNPQLQPPPGPPVIFSPTRHHWQSGGGSWTKGNDILLRAAGQMFAEGRTFRLRLVAWGQEVDKSRALIEALGYPHLVEWVPTMTKRQLWAAYCQSHVVADQFTLPALGGVAFETLSLGRRLLTRIDEATLEHFFGAAPPVLNGATVEEVAAKLAAILDDPDDQAGLGAQARRWIEVFHSSTRVVALQSRAYRDLMHDNDAPDIPAMPA
jgi:glycosyltransferase involved in cell wall biosynthesis